MKHKNIFSIVFNFISSIIDFIQTKYQNFKRRLKNLFISFGNTRFIKGLGKGFHLFKVKILRTERLKNHILKRYLYRDLFLYFIVAFLFFFMIFFVNQILLTVEGLLAKSAPFADVMRIMLYSLPFVIAQSAPFATLVGFLLCLGSMVANNEILIYRASGFSFRRLLGPVLVVGIIISIISFFVNDYLLPLGTVKYNNLMREIMNSKPSIELETNSIKEIDSSRIVIGNVNGSKVSDVIIFSEEGDSERIIIAGESDLHGGDRPGVLMQFEMNDAAIISIDENKPDDYNVLSSKKTIYNIFDAAVLGAPSLSAREMTAYDLGKEIVQMKLAAEYDDTIKYRLNLWIMEFHKKFALPFASIFFAFLAFSIAFQFKKHNSQTSGLFIGIVICVLYWAMQILGQLFVTRIGLDAFLCIWVPNFVLLISGIIFSIRLLRK